MFNTNTVQQESLVNRTMKTVKKVKEKNTLFKVYKQQFQDVFFKLQYLL